MSKKFLKPLHDKSMKTNLMALVNFCEQEAADDKVEHRRKAFVKTGQALKKLAESRYVTRLLDYME